ncbi:uncharacterized protein LOC135344519 [Halichondria panicea]|uniref:uncharacterized protein LOC135344519 n=1 Tax=Halichondria panicea TaxID=6063 RepID=UPI00312B6AC8
MPATKRWHFEFLVGGVSGITVYKNGARIKSYKLPNRPVLESVYSIGTPSTRKTCDKVKEYLDQAIEVTFKCKTTVLLNRKEFEWNKSAFCRLLRLSPGARAVDFIQVFNQLTKFNSDRGFLVPVSPLPTSSELLTEEALSDGGDSEDDHPLSSLTSTQSIDGSHQLGEKRSQQEEEVSRKRMKHKDTMDDAIFTKKIGTIDLQLRNLSEPKTQRCLRTVDTVFVEELVKKFTKDPSAPGVPPIAVLCISVESIDVFDTNRVDAYKYELLGGQHTALARRIVAAKSPDNTLLQTVLAEVYVGLTDDEALRLASRHNTNSHFIHKMTHRDYLEACRSKLFSMCGKAPEEETPKDSVEWKDVCKRCILPQDMGRCTMENIFKQASFTKEVWALAVSVMNLYEEGELKDQTLSTKSLTTKPEFKQQNFSPIQCLPDEFKLEMLSKVSSSELSLAELKEEATSYRSRKSLQRAFCK